MVELVQKLENGRPITQIKNLLCRPEATNVEKVELRPLVDLNSLHPFDYDLSAQYILENDAIRNVHDSDFRGSFITYSSRGCPYRCSYCCNHFILDIYKKQRYCRQRNIDLVLRELAHIKKTFPSCRHIWFNEADFLAGKSREQIEFFSTRYKTEIDIGFSIWSNPACITEHSIQALKRAGLKGINIGTIEGNDEAQKKIFNRNATRELYISSAEILHEHNMPAEYDFILCNPYESDSDIIQTIELLMLLPKPFKIVIYSLVYFTGTKLYEKARQDGFVKEGGDAKSYTKAAYKTWLFPVNTYMNGVASLMRGAARQNRLGIVFYGLLPETVLKFLIKKPVVYFFNHLPFRYFIFKCTGTAIKTFYCVIKNIRTLYRNYVIVDKNNPVLIFYAIILRSISGGGM